MTRRTKFGSYSRAARQRSSTTHTVFKPVDGWTSLDALDATPGSCVSGQNIWIEDGRLVPRSRLTRTHVYTDTSKSAGSGAFISGVLVSRPIESHMQNLFVMSGATMARLNNDNGVEGGGTWSILSMTAADSQEISITQEDVYYGCDILASGLSTWFVFTNGAGYPGVTSGLKEDDKYLFSYLTGAPNAVQEFVRFDNSPVAWGQRATALQSHINVVQWPTGSHCTDWTGVGAGSESLVDMRGQATRAFAEGEEMILASTEEIWRGRKIGGAYRFAFSPITRQLGMPYKHAAIQTPFGIYWLALDFMIYCYAGGSVTPVGQAILQTLRDDLDTTGGDSYVGPHPPHFFSYDPNKRAITFHYRQKNGPTNDFAQKAFTYFIQESRWVPQMFSFFGTAAQGFVPTSGWGYVDMNQAGLTPTGGSWGPPKNIAQTTFFGTSTGSVLQYSPTAAADDNTGATESQFVSGGLFTGDMERIKFLDDIRLDVRADSASSLTIKTSGNLGGAYANSSEIAISAQSNTTQTRVFPKVSGTYFALELTSEDTGWEVSRIGARARVTGVSL
jgi:hypothetical protein